MAIGVEGFYHPRKCGGVRYDHIDLRCLEEMLACKLARKRGLLVKCSIVNGCLHFSPRGYDSLWFELCPLYNMGFECVKDSVYIMKTLSGMLYVGPVKVVLKTR